MSRSSGAHQAPLPVIEEMGGFTGSSRAYSCNKLRRFTVLRGRTIALALRRFLAFDAVRRTVLLIRRDRAANSIASLADCCSARPDQTEAVVEFLIIDN
jgi:hypothetical protein